MRKLFYISFIACTLLIGANSCSISQKEFTKIDSNSWKSDTSGCSGYRLDNYNEVIDEKDVILGLNESQLKSLLGAPNQINLYNRGQKFFVYYVECHDPSSSSTKSIRIRFSAIGFASEVIAVNI